jgi:hypothetical protein
MFFSLKKSANVYQLELKRPPRDTETKNWPDDENNITSHQQPQQQQKGERRNLRQLEENRQGSSVSVRNLEAQKALFRLIQ